MKLSVTGILFLAALATIAFYALYFSRLLALGQGLVTKVQHDRLELLRNCTMNETIHSVVPEMLYDSPYAGPLSLYRALFCVTMLPETVNVLEIGTSYGGTALYIATALQFKKTGMLYTLEPDWDSYLRAQQNLKTLPVVPLPLPSVSVYGDLQPILPRLCERIQFDMVFIDGSEEMGHRDYDLAQSLCKPKIIALHDVDKLKTSQAHKELAADPRFQLILSGQDDLRDRKAAKWSIWKRRPGYVAPLQDSGLLTP